MKTKKIKRIKENITEVEFKKLMASVRGSESLRANTKSNLLRTFVILYFTGMRLNELQDLRVKDIKELIEVGTVKIFLKKTSSERKLYLTEKFKKEIIKLFDFEIEDDENRIISKGANKNKRSAINSIMD